MKSREEVDATFEAVPAYIVADKREKLGKRLGIAAMALLVLFFVISSYVQSADNGRRLDIAERQRQQLVDSTDRVAATIQGQTVLIVQLQDTIAKQNEALKAAGLPVEPVPTISDLLEDLRDGTLDLPAPTPGASADPNRSRQTEAPSRRAEPPAEEPAPERPAPRPSPRPTQRPPQPPPPPPPPPPSEPPRPLDPVTRPVCELTGICL